MHPNPLKRKLDNGEPVLGMWSIVPSPTLSEIFGLAGMDFLILDMEHGPFDLSGLVACHQCARRIHPNTATLWFGHIGTG